MRRPLATTAGMQEVHKAHTPHTQVHAADLPAWAAHRASLARRPGMPGSANPPLALPATIQKYKHLLPPNGQQLSGSQVLLTPAAALVS